MSSGATDGPIEIVAYDPSWQVSFIEERERISSILPGVEIKHIGSTAVPGLAAKAVIDMIALVDDLDANVAIVERAGYHMPAQFNAGLVHRRFLCYPSMSFLTHHLHLVDVREDAETCVRFREMLRANPKLAAEYVELKRALAKRFRANREAYTAAKTSFITGADAVASRLLSNHTRRMTTEGSRPD
jgi:GrpB-like predicted nucleotidyltransferase (UPF0157 family)